MKHILLVWSTKLNYILITVFLLAVVSCKTVPETIITENTVEQVEPSALSVKQKKIIEGSTWALGKTELYVNGRKFNLDCSGTVMAIYYYAGIDLARDFAKYSGGGTARIYQYLNDKKLIYETKNPQPGDIIFWDSTIDSNGDGQRNDKLTHMGIVYEVSEEGTITYIHEHYRLGIILETMNLQNPDDLESNSAMRKRGTGMEGGWLASHLYRESAMGHKLEM